MHSPAYMTKAMPGWLSTLSEIHPLHHDTNQSGICNELKMMNLASNNVILLKNFILTSSTIDSGLIGLEQGSDCHIIWPG